MKFNYNDGGRSKYFKGQAEDCVTRAIAIATGLDYKEVYDTIKDLLQHTPRNGLSKRETRDIMEYFGFTWVSLMTIGGGCHYHLRDDDLPSGNKELVKESQDKITQLTNKYREISKISGLPTRMERMRVSQYKRVNVNKLK